MTDSELSREIAVEVMGWEDWQQSPSPGAHFGAEGDLYKHGCVPRYWRDRTTGHIYYKVQGWSPSTDIAQAFEVAENLRERHQVVLSLYQGGTGLWHVQARKMNRLRLSEVSGLIEGPLPRAICMAALKAVGGES